jgi:hypothetical protein
VRGGNGRNGSERPPRDHPAVAVEFAAHGAISTTPLLCQLPGDVAVVRVGLACCDVAWPGGDPSACHRLPDGGWPVASSQPAPGLPGPSPRASGAGCSLADSGWKPEATHWQGCQ